MRLSTKCRYGLRALIDLALFSTEKQIALKDIAERQNVSLKYLEQEFSLLKRTGLVRSVKGSRGGYLLAKPAEEILLDEIIRALEGDTLIIDVDDKETSELRSFLQRHLWEQLNRDVEAYFHSISLADLVRDYLAKTAGGEMFYI